MSMLGITLSNVSFISRNMLTVAELMRNPLCTSHDKMTRLFMQDLFGLNPICESGIIWRDSINHYSRV